MITDSFLLDSITDATIDTKGQVVICGSHGGLYPGAIASMAGVRAVVFNDAGIGLDRAGVAGVLALEGAGMAAAAADCQSCHIGSASDSAARGIISVTNTLALEAGVEPGMPVHDAASLLARAPIPTARLPKVSEARRAITLAPQGLVVSCLDSASLVGLQDDGTVVVTGSHGALIGGDPARALKAAARVAVFNDAGFGLDRIGITRLAALDGAGMAAVTVSCQTARIGDAQSALETGVLSCANETARTMGALVSRPLRDWLMQLAP
jgi:hypothetical protein